MAGLDLLAGKHILIVEDDYFIAFGLASSLKAEGAVVIGPAPSLPEALNLIEHAERLDGAVLDVNLGGEMAYPIADALKERAVPFAFTSGYDRASISPRFADAPVVQKPFVLEQIAKAVFGKARLVRDPAG